MREIKGELTAELAEQVGPQGPAKAEPVPVPTYRRLMELVAQLSYLNKDHLLFFRGQSTDYKNKAGASSFYPSIYRGERLSREEVALRFDVLESSSRRLVDTFQRGRIAGSQEVRRRKYIQWSMLQHYEVCPTPLLDFTQSVRVACSFATLDGGADAYVFVFGLPYVTNRISVNSEQDLVNVRLLSICPPDALRPYFQEGYLAGTDEVTTDYGSSKNELDFTRRLIAKFRIRNAPSFWGQDFTPIPRAALYPDGDRMGELCAGIRDEVGTEVEAGQLGRFLQAWAGLEGRLMTLARARRARVFSVREAIDLLARDGVLTAGMRERLDAVRATRNTAAHEPSKLKPGQLAAAGAEMEVLSPVLWGLGRTETGF